MLILSVIVVGLIISIIIANNFEFDTVGGLIGMLGTFTLSFTLFLAIIAIPISRMEVRSGIEEFKSIEHTAERMRENERIVESAAFHKKIADANQELASAQYWNDTVFDLWIPDEVDELEPIE